MFQIKLIFTALECIIKIYKFYYGFSVLYEIFTKKKPWSKYRMQLQDE